MIYFQCTRSKTSGFQPESFSVCLLSHQAFDKPLRDGLQQVHAVPGMTGTAQLVVLFGVAKQDNLSPKDFKGRVKLFRLGHRRAQVVFSVDHQERSVHPVHEADGRVGQINIG
ncbi:hypothetical protein SY88_07620 [Clostridiales bacterium PH28_bin88]|nr:hypothetical protein SY88_07620 [Clostridiales bacterium PH28_bin88]